MAAMLASRSKDLLCAVEFYASTYTPHVSRGFEPDDAIAKFATETVPVYVFHASITVAYSRDVFEAPAVTRSIDKQSNSCTVKLSNVPKSVAPSVRPLAAFVLTNEVEGMRMVVRWISRANLTDPLGAGSWVQFVGRCLKQDGFNRQSGTITAKQDLGQIQALIPPQVFQKDCPIDFGGTECLGTELLTDKNAAYQTAFATFGRFGCNKTHGQCTTYENTEFFQGTRVLQLPGSFRHKPHHGLLYKLIRYTTPVGYLASRLFGKKARTVDSSLEDGTPYGSAIPVVLGRSQREGIPLQFRDDGETIHFKMAFARGPINEFYNIRCNDPAFGNPPVTVVGHYGRYGGEAGQDADTVFPDASFHSRLAYLTGGVIGSNIEVEDPVPPISAIIAGATVPKVTVFNDSAAGEGTTDSAGVFSQIAAQWSDNPVEQIAFLLTDASYLNLGWDSFDQTRSAKTAVYAKGAIRDNTNAERLVLPDTETGLAGVDYTRYHSTGVVIINGEVGSASPTIYAGQATEVTYEFYDPDAPPASVALKTRYRKRYTSNIAIVEQRKVVDVIHDTLLPTFRGFLSWDTFGRISVRSERPADSTNLYAASIASATTIKVNDVLPWKLQFHENNVPLIGKLLIGVGLTTSEVRPISSAAYTADSNSITLSASSVGTVTVSASGANLSGGSSSVQASGTVTVTSDFGDVGDVITVVIDGITVEYEIEGSGINKFKIANAVAFAINATPILNKYIVAHDNTSGGVQIQSKQGVLTLSSALANAHDIDEETIRVMMSFAGQAANFTAANVTVANILDGSFKYEGSAGQTRYNEFKGTFHDPLRDFAEQPVIIRDYAHQAIVKKVNAHEIDLSAVDNFNQASRLLNGAASKHGDLTEFFSWASNGLALQLEEGDPVCVSDTSGGFINQPVRIESLTVNSKYEVSFKARQYSTSAYDDFVEQTDVPLVTGTGFGTAPAAITFNTVDFPPNGLVQSTDGTAGITSIRGGAIFPTRRNATHAFVRLIKRAGVVVNEQVGIIYPDDNLEAVFEFIASADGIYTVELEVCNQWGCNTTKPTADIIIGFGTLFGIAKQGGILITKQGGTIMEKQHA